MLNETLSPSTLYLIKPDELSKKERALGLRMALAGEGPSSVSSSSGSPVVTVQTGAAFQQEMVSSLNPELSDVSEAAELMSQDGRQTPGTISNVSSSSMSEQDQKSRSISSCHTLVLGRKGSGVPRGANVVLEGNWVRNQAASQDGSPASTSSGKSPFMSQRPRLEPQNQGRKSSCCLVM